MRIELERWQAAQTEEFSHHQDLRIEAYITATNVIAKYFDIDYKKDFKDKVIVQVGAGPRGSILSTEGNFKRGLIVEPLIDRWPSNIREDYEKVGIEIIAAPYEDLDIDEPCLKNKNCKTKLYHHNNYNVLNEDLTQASSLKSGKENISEFNFEEVDEIDFSNFLFDINDQIELIKIDIEGYEIELINHLTLQIQNC